MPRWVTATEPLKLPEPVEMTEIQKTYFAGHFDADANVDISCHSYNSSWSLHTNINPREADVRILELWQKYFGRKIGDVPKKRSKQWQTSGEKAAKLQVTIYPYLRIRRREAQYGLAFYCKYPTIPASVRDQLCLAYSDKIRALHYEERELEPFGEITEKLKAYLAGYTDGDGSVGLDDVGESSGKVKVGISSDSCCASQFEALKTVFGGHIYRDKEKEAIQWSVGSAQAVYFLKIVSPYFFLKTEQCRLALEFDYERSQLPRTVSKLELFRKYDALISQLNQRKPLTLVGKYD